jgi:hypothetical protein
MRPEREAGHSGQLSAQVKCLDKVMLTYISLPSLYLPKHDLHTRTDYASSLLSVWLASYRVPVLLNYPYVHNHAASVTLWPRLGLLFCEVQNYATYCHCWTLSSSTHRMWKLWFRSFHLVASHYWIILDSYTDHPLTVSRLCVRDFPDKIPLHFIWKEASCRIVLGSLKTYISFVFNLNRKLSFHSLRSLSTDRSIA